MKKVVLVELHLDENAKSDDVLDSVRVFSNPDPAKVVTQQDHDNLATIKRIVKIHESKAHG